MKKLLLVLVLLMLVSTANSEDFIVSNSEYIIISGSTTDTLGREPLVPDSIVIFIVDSNQTTLHNASYTSASAQASLDGDYIKFADQWNDLNGAAEIGIFHMTVTVWSDANNNIDVSSEKHYTIRGISSPLDGTLENLDTTISSRSTLSETSNIGINWADVSNQTTAVNLTNTTTNLVNTATTVTNKVGLDLDNTTGTLSKTEIPYLSYFDSLMYNGGRGMGIWIDGGAGNTNTVIGVDGTKKNPVSTLAAAKTIADALGATRYYFTQRTSLTLAATHEDWEFVGDGVNNIITLGSQDIDGTYIYNMVVTGSKGGTGDITLENCVINDLLLMDGFWFHCGIDGTNSIASSDDLFVMNCFSMVAGNGTPVIDFGAGICELSIRNYSGSIEIQNMDGDDGASIETDGQVIMNVNCTNANVTVRGMMTLTDNDGGTTWTRDAVYSRQEVGIEAQARENWNIAGSDDTTYAAGTMGKEAELWDATGASSGVDSTVLSNMLWRIVMGGANAGTQPDSSTIAQRLANVWGIAVEATLKSLIVSNSDGDAVQFLSPGASGNALYTFSTNGHGFFARGGTGTGDAGIYAFGARGMQLNGINEDMYLIGDGFISSAIDTVMMRGDSLINQGSSGGGSDTSAIIEAIHNNFLPYVETNRRYVSPDGDNSDGLTWTTAWTDPDSIASIVTGEGYNVYVDAYDYGVVWGVELNVAHMSLIPVNGTPVWRYNVDTLASGQWDPANGNDVGQIIKVNAPYYNIDGFRFVGGGLYAYPHYGRDPDASHVNPDSTLSVANVGGKNAIRLDTLADIGIIQNCMFDSSYKPIIQMYVSDSLSSSGWGNYFIGNTFKDCEYHAIDAALSYSVIKGNDIIKSNVSNHPAAGAIQLIGRMGAYNLVYDNNIHGYGFGVYSNVSDSNFYTNNSFGAEIISDGAGSAMRVFDNTNPRFGPYAWFVNNKVADWVDAMSMEGGRNLIANSGFELKGKDRHHIPLWAGNDWSQNQSDSGASFYIAPFGFVDENQNSVYRTGAAGDGRSLFIMIGGSLDKYIHQNSNRIYLEVGQVEFSARLLPNTPIVANDSVRFALFEDTLNDGTFSLYEEYYFLSNGGSLWELASNSFSIVNSGEYYFSMAVWNVDSGDGFYFDDIFLGQYAGEVIASSSAPTVEQIDAKLTSNHGAGAWTGGASGDGSNSIAILSYDSSNSVAVQSVRLTVINTATKVVQGIPQYSSALGYTLWNLDNASYEIYSFLGLWMFNVDTITVTGEEIFTVLGYPVSLDTSAVGHVCAVSIVVINNEGNTQSGVRVYASLTKSNLADSSGNAIQTITLSDTTNVSGVVTFKCLSSYWMVPNTKWSFSIPSNGVKFKALIPDQSSILLDINDYK